VENPEECVYYLLKKIEKKNELKYSSEKDNS
jgi:hypothetical protein